MKKNQKKSKSSKSSRQSNNRRPSLRPRQREENEMLAEFSDDYNEFYVDEVAESRRREREEQADRREDSRAARRKPSSPLKRKIIRIVSTVAIVAVILIVGVILSLTVLFKTSAYEVIGNTLYLEEDIIKTCGIAEGENIFLAGKSAAEERIVERFPYVEEANVTFKIPDTIKIEITQANEDYLYKVSETEYLVISSKGCVLNRTADKSAYQLPVFIGPELKSGEVGQQVVFEDDSVMEIIGSITQIIRDNGFQGVTEINAAKTSSITFTYDGRIRVKLGLPEDLSYKIRTAMTVISGSIDVNPSARQRGTLDVSRCKETKRSYFREGDISLTEPTEPAATAPTVAPTESSADWTDDGSDDWTDDGSSDWTDDGAGDWSDDWTDSDYDWEEDDWNE